MNDDFPDDFWHFPGEQSRAFIKAGKFETQWLCFPGVALWDSGKELAWFSDRANPWDVNIGIISPGGNPILPWFDDRNDYTMVDGDPVRTVDMPAPTLIDCHKFEDLTYVLWYARSIDQEVEALREDVYLYFVSKSRYEDPFCAFQLPEEADWTELMYAFHAYVEIIASYASGDPIAIREANSRWP